MLEKIMNLCKLSLCGTFLDIYKAQDSVQMVQKLKEIKSCFSNKTSTDCFVISKFLLLLHKIFY